MLTLRSHFESRDNMLFMVRIGWDKSITTKHHSKVIEMAMIKALTVRIRFNLKIGSNTKASSTSANIAHVVPRKLMSLNAEKTHVPR